MASSFLHPIETATRAMRDLSGIWRFRIDWEEKGLHAGWRGGLPADAEPMAVPSDWREICTTAESETHTGAVWFETDAYLPAEWTNRELLLWFGGAPCPTVAWVNGAEIVRDAGSRFPFCGKLNGAEIHGRICKIVVRVSGIYAGIYRPVKLLALPKESIRDFTIETSFGGGDGKIGYAAELNSLRELTVELYAPDKQLIASANGREGELSFHNAQIWEPENPTLYTVRVVLHDGTHLLDEYYFQTGIREAEVRENRIFINRRPFYSKGFLLSYACADSKSLVRDFTLIRWIGANAVSVSWASEEFLQLADKEGLLVLCKDKPQQFSRHPCCISLPETVFATRRGEASAALEKSALKDWLEMRSRVPGPIILSGYGAGALAGNRCISCKKWSEEYQSAYLEAQNAAIDDCENVVGELLPFLDGEEAEGVFSRERRPKAAAFALQKRWKRLDARTHKY